MIEAGRQLDCSTINCRCPLSRYYRMDGGAASQRIKSNRKEFIRHRAGITPPTRGPVGRHTAAEQKTAIIARRQTQSIGRLRSDTNEQQTE